MKHPTLAFSHRVQKSVLYICVSFSVLHIGLLLHLSKFHIYVLVYCNGLLFFFFFLRPTNFHNFHRSPRSLQLLQPTGYSAISPTQGAAMARASDLTWGSNQRPQKLPCVRIDIMRPPISTLAAGTRTKFTVLSGELSVQCQDLLGHPPPLDKLDASSAPQCPSPWTSHSKSCLNICTRPTLRWEPPKWC